MPILSAVLTLQPDPALRAATLSWLHAHPDVTVGEAFGERLPIVLDTPDRDRDRQLWQALERLPGVAHLAVVSAHFSDLVLEAPHTSEVA